MTFITREPNWYDCKNPMNNSNAPKYPELYPMSVTECFR